MEKFTFGTTPEGQEVYLFRLQKAGIIAEILNYGGILKSLLVPDKNGNLADVVLGFDSLGPYLGPHPCFGTINGRFANRIAKGHFSLNGKAYSLAINNGPNHLHGGLKGFDKVLWEADMQDELVMLKYNSPHMEEGYPGNLTVEVNYSLTEQGGLLIDYKAETDQDTVLNLTNHSYFNLAGGGNVKDHELKVWADQYTPTDATNIPLGKLANVENTPFDFRAFKAIGMDWEKEDEQLSYGSGYDHNFVLNKSQEPFPQVAEVYEPTSGRRMKVYSTEPGLQLYTANHLKGIVGKKGIKYHARDAFCLELQHFPDSPNQPEFPTTVLRAGEVYRQQTEYRFS